MFNRQTHWMILVLIGSTLTIILNHASVDIGYYAPESKKQASGLERGSLVRVGSYVAGIDLDGSVVWPLGLSNYLRTLAIDGIVAAQAIALIAFLVRERTTLQTKIN